jgi:hypothetical protein
MQNSNDSAYGEMYLHQNNDTGTLYSFRLTYPTGSMELDLDTLESINVHDHIVMLTSRKRKWCVIVSIPIDDEIRGLQQCVKYCNYLCELTLRMKALANDYYYAGVYTAMEKEEEKSYLKHNSQALLPIPTPFELVEASVEDRHFDEASRNKILSTKCIFCLTEKRNSNADYYIHPYVPLSYAGDALAMCDACLGEWQHHRKSATERCELILEGEENEEICAVCSDTHIEIIMCSSCVRSFCNSCLRQVQLTIIKCILLTCTVCC